jgi:hypothetical protein
VSTHRRFRSWCARALSSRLAMGCDAKQSHCVRGDAASCPPVPHPLRHEAIGGIEDHEGSSIEGGKDVFDQRVLSHHL